MRRIDEIHTEHPTWLLHSLPSPGHIYICTSKRMVLVVVSKWVFIEWHYRNYWTRPIIKAIHENTESSVLEPFEGSISKITHSICTRLDMIGYIENRMQYNLDLIKKELMHLKKDNISTRDKSGRAYLIDNYLIYRTLIDIDSFLFEINASCELIGKFAEVINCLVRSNIKTKGSEICKLILREHSVDTNWFSKLDRSRNDFIHETAPYIAIDTSCEGHYDLLIMKENLKSFDDRTKYVTLTDLITIKEGFYDSLPVLQAGLVKLVKGQ